MASWWNYDSNKQTDTRNTLTQHSDTLWKIKISCHLAVLGSPYVNSVQEPKRCGLRCNHFFFQALTWFKKVPLHIVKTENIVNRANCSETKVDVAYPWQWKKKSCDLLSSMSSSKYKGSETFLVKHKGWEKDPSFWIQSITCYRFRSACALMITKRRS